MFHLTVFQWKANYVILACTFSLYLFLFIWIFLPFAPWQLARRMKKANKNKSNASFKAICARLLMKFVCCVRCCIRVVCACCALATGFLWTRVRWVGTISISICPAISERDRAQGVAVLVFVPMIQRRAYNTTTVNK